MLYSSLLHCVLCLCCTKVPLSLELPRSQHVPMIPPILSLPAPDPTPQKSHSLAGVSVRQQPYTEDILAKSHLTSSSTQVPQPHGIRTWKGEGSNHTFPFLHTLSLSQETGKEAMLGPEIGNTNGPF